MSENITPNETDRKGSLIRRRNIGNSGVAKWDAIPGFQYAEAVDLMRKGVVYKTIWEIYGEGPPGSDYDSATPGSVYHDTTYGWIYNRIKIDNGTLTWMTTIMARRTTASDTTSYTSAPQGGVILVKDDGTVYIKSEEEGTDEVIELSPDHSHE